MVTVETLSNGLVVLVEEMPHVESAAYDLHIPGGIVTDDTEYLGSSLILAELTSRGAGKLGSREISEAFDGLGIGHSESAGTDRFFYRGSLLADKLEPALTLVSSMVKEPTLPDDEIESIRSILLQDIAALNDNPARRVIVELSTRYFPAPYNRSSQGDEAGLKRTSVDVLRADWTRRFRAKGAILSVAGKVNTSEVIKLAKRLFGDWGGECVKRPAFGKFPAHQRVHLHFDSAQLQVALAFPSAKFGDADFYTAKVAAGILSGGMFGRLFIEVREKRGLCYSVFARHSGSNDYGCVTAYAGTTPERAHETLDVMIKVLRELKGTITAEELDRSKANLKSSLIIGEESSGARASSNAGDYWLGGRVRPLEEILAEVNRVTLPAIDAHLEKHALDSFMLITLGAKEINHG